VGAIPDTTSAAPTVPVPATPASKPVAVLSWTDLILLDLGADAKAEITQQPEPLPEGAVTPPGGTH
jgi:hypothetical protein